MICRTNIKYPTPGGLRPRALQPFHVADLCKAYNFPRDMPGGGVIGILELGGGYQQGDLDTFASLNGLPRFQVTNLSVNGGINEPGTEADGEVLLDIQVAVAAYHYCTGHLPDVRVFFAPNAIDSFEAVFAAAVATGCDVLSISWGLDERAWGRQDLDHLEAAATKAVTMGLTIFAASGDNSSGDGDPGANVDAPASCPHVIGCGGTTKVGGTDTVWGNGRPNGRGTGGGYSGHFLVQPWQYDTPKGPVRPGRMVPDVAAAADPNTGYLIVANGMETEIGGTSAVAPLYSGLFASFGRKLGFVTPALYATPKAFVDVTHGSNGAFHAQAGPDPCTGLGVPDGELLAKLFHRGA